ncbi:MAG: tRNA (adenosine(37)-N6)-dimethylallyltransferase MiaA, partial [Woeseiaceae bacterium]|nr:tRNA (adenosine(37)-N6)-dimethylallyltransferase MiaA [Woeseiaceae bacterium]
RHCPAMRSVGYRQFWEYLDGNCSFEEARDKALFATRQLAKRQLTWLRSEKSLFFANSLEAGVIDTISKRVAEFIR